MVDRDTKQRMEFAAAELKGPWQRPQPYRSQGPMASGQLRIPDRSRAYFITTGSRTAWAGVQGVGVAVAV